MAEGTSSLKKNKNVNKDKKSLYCKVGNGKKYEAEFPRSLQPKLSQKLACANEQAYQCWKLSGFSLVNKNGLPKQYKKISFSLSQAHKYFNNGSDHSMRSILNKQETNHNKNLVKKYFKKAIKINNELIEKMQSLGVKCSGPLK